MANELNKATSQWKMNENDPYPVGLVARWPFNDNLATTAVVDVKGSSDGAFAGTSGAINTEDAQATTKVLGTSALAFDATNNEAINFGNPAALQMAGDEVSMAAWIKTSMSLANFARGGVIAKKDGVSPFLGYGITLIGDGTRTLASWGVGGAFSIDAGGLKEGNSIRQSVEIDVTDGEWHHIAGTYGTVSGWQIGNAAASVVAGGVSGRVAENIEFDSVTDKFWWIFTDLNTGQVILASTDGTGNTKANIGAGNWTLEGSGLFDGIAPCIKKFGSTWYIYYKNVVTGNIDVRSSATVNSGYGAATVAVTKDGVGSWSEERADEPYVFLRNGLYHMIYMGESSAATDLVEATGLATSPNPDGPFTKNPANPIFSGQLNVGRHWNSGFDCAADPYAFQLDSESDTWYVGFSAVPTAKANGNIGYYSTADFKTFTPVSEANPILSQGDATSSDWDSRRVIRGAALFVEDTWYISYAGQDETGVFEGGLTTLNVSGASKIAKLYIDGVWDAEVAPAVGTVTNTVDTFYAGLALGYLDDRYNGDLDDVLVFNTRLTDAEVLALYNSKHHTIQPDAIGDNDALASLSDVEPKSVASTGDMSRAQTFDGTDDHFIIPTADNINPDGTPITVCVWIKPSTLVGNADIVGKYNPGVSMTYMMQTVSGVPRFYSGGVAANNPAIATTTMVADRWYFLVGVYDGTNTKIYINGEFEANAVTPIAPVQSTTDLILGARYAAAEPDYADNEFAGDMDNVMIYNLALTAAEISNLYNDGAGLETDPARGRFFTQGC